jgi:FkbM family methyltransferase
MGFCLKPKFNEVFKKDMIRIYDLLIRLAKKAVKKFFASVSLSLAKVANVSNKAFLYYNSSIQTVPDVELDGLSACGNLKKFWDMNCQAYSLIKTLMKKVIAKIFHIIPFKKEIYSIIRNFYIPSSYASRPIKGDIKLFWNRNNYFKIYSDYDLYIETELFWLGFYGGWEKKSLELWVKLCKTSDTIFDVGANSGIYSLIAQSVNPNSVVFAFEPIERNLELLNYNNKLNKFNIRINNNAVSSSDGQATMFILPNVVNYMASVNKNRYVDKEVIETSVSTIKLSSFITMNNIEKVDLIKIDVEGHELEVLQGLEPYLKKMAPTLLIEIIGDTNAYKIQNLLKDLNYLYFLIDEINEPQLIDVILDKDHHNYLICSPETAKKINLI